MAGVCPVVPPIVTSLAEFTRPALILPQLRGQDATAVIGEMCAALLREGCIHDEAAFRTAVLNRESRCNTAMAPGWAMPHVRGSELPRLCFALGRTAQPLDWFGGVERVQTVFVLAVPDSQGMAYLNLISGLASLSGDTLRLERLHRAADSQAMFEVLSEVALRPTPPAPAQR
jgi:fructose PTS system EIIBC or EIIC component